MKAKDRIKRIFSEDTVIPVSFVILIIAFAGWLISIANTGQANAEAIVELRGERKEFVEAVQAIDKRLSYFEGYMKKKEQEK
jgi:hypothetical protein